MPPHPTHGPDTRSPRTYAEFWPLYLADHRHPANRALHFAGTGLALGLLGAAVVTGAWWMAAAAPVAGYGFAWIGHFVVEGNRPATFTHPLWSLFSDVRMAFLWLAGRLGRELERAGVAQD